MSEWENLVQSRAYLSQDIATAFSYVHNALALIGIVGPLALIVSLHYSRNRRRWHATPPAMLSISFCTFMLWVGYLGL